MPRMTAALAAPTASAPLEAVQIERRDPRANDVVIDIAYSGICHSDIHQAREEWGEAIFPMVPGHEIVGTVIEVGSAVSKFSLGDRVGVGCYVDSCRECDPCKQGVAQYCEKGEVGTYNARFYDGEPSLGGYSGQITVDENYVLRVPESLDFAQAAPLLCAGITMYSPLKHWNAGPGKRVAIVGMGGLGHMGVKLAHAMGAEVTVISASLSKAEDGKKFGAHRYLAASDPATFSENRDYFDLILNTVSENIDTDAYLKTLRLDGTMVNVGIPSHPDQVSMFALAMQRRSLSSTKNGGIPETQEMLDFCAEHGLSADIELLPAEAAAVNAAWQRVVNSDVRYRFVIDVRNL